MFTPEAYIASCRLTLTAPSNQPGFGEVDNNPNTTAQRTACLLLKVMFKSADYQNHASASLKYHPVSKRKTPPQSNACHHPRNEQARRRPVQPPGSNTRVCLDLVSKIFVCQKLLYVVYVWIDVVVLKLIPPGEEAPKRRRGKVGPRRCRGYADGQGAIGGCGRAHLHG